MEHRYETVLYTEPADHIARIVMNRPEARNAQDLQLTYDLNEAFDRAAQDDQIKCMILAGSDPHFSAGHDLRSEQQKRIGTDWRPIGTWGGFGLGGAEGLMAREEEVYLQMCRRWRNIPKPTIAEVQGKCIAGGLMLAWVCDIILASDDASFQDLTVQFGCNGAEFFAHPWELGHRKAKEMLFTSDWVSAEEAWRLGMVNHVVPRSQLSSFTLEMAQKIATKPMFALKLTKEAVNQTLDAQGQWTAMQATYNLHALSHSHNMQLYGHPVDPSGLPDGLRGRFAGAGESKAIPSATEEGKTGGED